MSNEKIFHRSIIVYSRDSQGDLLKGTDFEWKVNEEPAGSALRTDGHATITLIDCEEPLDVFATYGQGAKQQSKHVKLAVEQDNFTFHFKNVTLHPKPSFWGDLMQKHLAGFIGIGFVLLAVVLGFTFGSPTPLQHRIILVVLALGGGAFGTEISGMIKTDLSLGKKLTISATGAAAIFVILFFFVPAPTEG